MNRSPVSHHFCLALLLLSIPAEPSFAFTAPSTFTGVLSFTNQHHPFIGTSLFQTSEESKKKVAVGSSEYYKGFLGRSLNEEPAERVSGDAILGPTFKFVGGFSIILVMLTLGFLASNGLV